MFAAIRMALLTIRLVMRTKAALFFTFIFPQVFLFVYAGIFARGNPQAVTYMFGPVVTLNVMGSAFWGLGLQSVVQRERGSLRRYRLAPIGPGSIVASNLLANYLLQLPTIGLLVFSARVFFRMPMSIGWPTLLLLVTIGTIGFAGFGLTIASIANTMQEAQIYNNLVWLTLLFLSGTTVPLPLLPHWIQRLSTFLPATYLVSSFQSIMMEAQPLARHWPEMAALVVSGAFGLLLAWKLFRWEKDERIPAARKAWAASCVLPFLLVGFWMNLFANPVVSWKTTYSFLDRTSSRTQGGASAPSAEAAENFEGYPSDEALQAHWRIVEPDVRSTANSPRARLSLISPGARESAHALRVEGNLAGDQDELVIEGSLAPPAGSNPVRGIEFSVRGDSRPIAVAIVGPVPTPTSAVEIRFVPSKDWEVVRLPISGDPAAPAGLSRRAGSQDRWRIQITVNGFKGDFAFDLDEIRFY
jgi:ABC-2 type transport system permease protein